MEPSTGSEQTAGTKPLSGGCEETASGSSALELEADKPSESVEGGAPEQQPPGKLKKTAFKLFGGRKSICTLPSFFGGRNKGHGKVSSKKGMSKSKTHDCITEVSWEDGKRAGDVPAGDFEYHCQKKFCDGKLSTDKSSSFPRPKRGLKGLFSSIRRHKKNKAVDSEKSNTTEVSGENLKDSLAARQSSTSKLETECQDCLAGTNLPVMQNSRETLIGMPECAEDDIVLENSVAKGDTDHTEPLHEDQIVKNVEHAQAEIAEILNVGGTTLCTDSKVTCSPDVNPDCIDNDPPSVHSSDQISLIFGDVASLKSFDSLTGCGDIIADQDDDSVAESTISGERNRNAGKRSSCYVTYQGGGEEMATPDEVDEDYLQDVWDNEAAADVCYTPSQQPNLMEHDTNLQMIPEAPAIPCPRLDGSANPSFLRAVVETTHSSGSSFAQNVQVLPAMVTFDVVDMENEGECDRQMDMVTDEDISSPFEAYDESYLQKDAFAECDDRMFEFYEQSSFLSNSWGVASLPRHLSLSRVSPPMPSPLSLNRRSRSLDTDSLEFDLGDAYPVQSRDSTQFIPVSRSEWDSRKASSLYWSSEKKRNGQSASSELRQNASAVRSRQQEPACSFTMPVAEEKRIGHAQSFKKGACNPILLSSRQMARPSHLPLQSGDCPSHLESNSTGTFCKNNAHVTPLDDRREAYFSGKPLLMQFPEVSHQPTKIKPVGITQGVPHFCSDTNETLKPAHSEEQQEFTSKGRNELEMVVPVGCNNNTT
ncbi:AMER1 protein, partial [Atractosteus spatula]|nr:AMER1 protein [Atractosteus spatula]